MQFPKDQVISMIEQRMGGEQAQQAQQQLPDQVDHEQHAGLLNQFGIDPQELMGQGGGQGQQQGGGFNDPGQGQQFGGGGGGFNDPGQGQQFGGGGGGFDDPGQGQQGGGYQDQGQEYGGGGGGFDDPGQGQQGGGYQDQGEQSY